MAHDSVISLLAMLVVGTAAAQQDAKQLSPAASQMGIPELAGHFEEHGVTLRLGYTAETFSAVRGGVRTKRNREYLGSFAPSVTLDFSRLGFGRGQLYVSGQVLRRGGISESSVGAVQALSNLEEQPFGRFMEA